MEADLVKWIWANLPTLTVGLVLARVYFRACQFWAEQERRCQMCLSQVQRMKNVLLSEFPKRARDILEDKGKGESSDD